MAKYLPPYPSLESLQNQAKQLLQAHRAKHVDARRRVNSAHPRFTAADTPPALHLAEAQLVIAREYGFDSWPKLKRHVEAATNPQVPVPTIDDLSPRWLTSRLRLRGILFEGEVAGIEREDTFPRKEGIHRLRVTYSPNASPALPSSYIYKYNTKGSHRPHPSSLREIFFYRRLVPELPDYRVAACFDMGSTESQGSYLLLEDLEETHQVPPATQSSPFGGWVSFQEATVEQFEAVARKMARFQARWWNDPIIHREPLSAASPGLGSLNDCGDSANVSTSLAQLERLTGELGDDMTSTARRCILEFPRLYQDRLRVASSLTLVHVDLHLRHTFFPRSGSPDDVVIIDWETVQRSVGVSDIIHLLLSSMLPVDLRRSIESRVIDAYHAELLNAGVAGYSLDDCHADIRLSIVGLIGTVIAAPFVRSSIPAFNDWECGRLLGSR